MSALVQVMYDVSQKRGWKPISSLRPRRNPLRMFWSKSVLASCLIYARTLLEYVNFIVWVMRSVNKMLPSVKFAEYEVLTFLILREKC